MYTPERRNNRNLECPGAPQRSRPQNRYNFGNNIPPFPNLDLVENDIPTTPLQLRFSNIPDAPLKSNSFWSQRGRDRQDDIRKCCRRLFQ